MLCVVIRGPTYEEVYTQIKAASRVADLVELRVDLFDHLDLQELKRILPAFRIPMIFTLRGFSQGGSYQGSDHKRMGELKEIAALEPAYLDLDHDLPSSFIREIASCHPNIKIILSSHHFSETPANLDALYHSMQKQEGITFYKVATFAKSALEALRLMNWAKNFTPQLIPVSMGLEGQIGRVLAAVIGSPLVYACLDEKQQTAPGQMRAEILLDRYHYRSLNRQTALYGLIGDPVDQSISDKTHNHFFHFFGIDALYLKMAVKPVELEAFLALVKELNFSGLSVTMPLKEKILPYLDAIDAEALKMGASNTLVREEEKFVGFNTDALGALNAIERGINCGTVKGKRLVIIGAGGSAKAIAYEATRRGAFLVIINRDKKKAKNLAESLGGKVRGGGLEEMEERAKEGYDILINATPLSMPIPEAFILSGKMIMDIKTVPKDSGFILAGLKKECQIVYGYEMFIEQAIGQFSLWFKNRFSLSEARQVLKEESEKSL